MAELIGKWEILTEFLGDVECIRENGKFYLSAEGLKKYIDNLPTTTEAEIRAKAVSEFAKRVRHKIMSEIDECADELEWITEIEWQLKEEQ